MIAFGHRTQVALINLAVKSFGIEFAALSTLAFLHVQDDWDRL